MLHTLRVSRDDEERELRVRLTSTVATVEATAAQLFECGSPGAWGLYHAAEREECWLEPRRALGSYVPLAGKLEWKERGRMAEVVLLSGTRTRVRIDDGHTVGELKSTIAAKLGLAPGVVCEYGVKFGGKLSAGLTSTDVLRSGWLDEAQTLQAQGATANAKLELLWLKRWYVSDHSLAASDDTAIHYAYFEARHAFLSDWLDTTRAGVAVVSRAAAALLHVDHGKYDKRRHTHAWFVGKRYVPDSCSDLVPPTTAASAWRSMEDLTPAAAKKLFLDLCRALGGYGCTYFDAQWTDVAGPVVVAVDNETLSIYSPWSNQARRPGDRRLSRSALALSPRGAGSLDDEGTIGRASGERKLSSASLAALAPDAKTEGSSPGKDIAPVPVDDPGKRSPRGGSTLALKRTFTLRSRKASSPNLGASPSRSGSSADISRPAAARSDTLSRSGRFKGLGLLKRSGTLRDSELVADSDPAISDAAAAASTAADASSDSSVAEGPDAELSLEHSDLQIDKAQRHVLRSFDLADLRRWSVWGPHVVLDAEGAWSALRLTLPSPEAASDLSDLLLGYCSFRIEEAPAQHLQHSLAEASAHVQAPATAAAALELVTEALERLALRAPAVPVARARMLATRASTPKEWAEFVAANQDALASPAASAALASLKLAVQCAFPEVEVDEEQAANPVLELLRARVLAVVRLFAAFANGMLATQSKLDKVVDALEPRVDELLAPLEEAHRRPHALDTHTKLVRVAQRVAPSLAKVATQMPKLINRIELQLLAAYARDAMLSLLAMVPEAEDACASVGAVDRVLWDAAAALRASSASAPWPAVLDAVNACMRIVRHCGCEPWASTALRLDALQPLLLKLISAPLRPAASNSQTNATSTSALGAAVLQLLTLVRTVHRMSSGSGLLGEGVLAWDVVLGRSDVLSQLVRLRAASPTLQLCGLERVLAQLSANYVDAEPCADEALVRQWAEEWKEHMATAAPLLKALKSDVRAADPSLRAGLATLEQLGGALVELTRPFYGHGMAAAGINIVRTYQLLCAQVLKLACADEDARPRRLAKAVREVDALVSVLNFHNPALLQSRARPVMGDIGVGGGWQRRGELSNKGAALKQVLTQKAEPPKYLTRRNPAPAVSATPASASASTATAPSALAAQSPPTTPSMPRVLSQRQSSRDSRRNSGQWNDDDEHSDSANE